MSACRCFNQGDIPTQGHCGFVCITEVCNTLQDFLFQQTMYRIKDPKKSLPFYTGVLGMTLLQKYDFPDAKFSLYFMGYENPAHIPPQNAERSRWAMSRKATLELTQ